MRASAFRAWSIIIAIFSVPIASRAQTSAPDSPTSISVHVVGSGLNPQSLCQSIGAELHRVCVLTDGSNTDPLVDVQIERMNSAAVTYRDATARVITRTIALPDDRVDATRRIALLVGNLVRNEALQLVQEMMRPPASTAPIALSSEPVAPQASATPPSDAPNAVSTPHEPPTTTLSAITVVPNISPVVTPIVERQASVPTPQVDHVALFFGLGAAYTDVPVGLISAQIAAEYRWSWVALRIDATGGAIATDLSTELSLVRCGAVTTTPTGPARVSADVRGLLSAVFLIHHSIGSLALEGGGGIGVLIDSLTRQTPFGCVARTVSETTAAPAVRVDVGAAWSVSRRVDLMLRGAFSAAVGVQFTGELMGTLTLGLRLRF